MTPSFDRTSWQSEITECAGLLVAGTGDDDLIPMGSGILCAPFLALTARHVVDEIFERFEGCRPHEATGTLSFGVHFAHRKGAGLLKWHVVDYGYSTAIDIAALVLEPFGVLPADFSWCLPRFQAMPPSVGERVVGFGFPKSYHQITDKGDASIVIDPHTAVGCVEEVHYEYRDKAMLPFPCFRTDARIDSGMSGGPVFNPAGEVCGIASSSLPPAGDYHAYSSHVSLIWAALGLELKTALGPPRRETEKYLLKHIVDRGAMVMLNADKISVTGGVGVHQLRFRPDS